MTTIRPATSHDRTALTTLYLAMLTELEPLGNDMVATLENAVRMVDLIIIPAIGNEEGIVVSQEGEKVTGFCAFARNPLFDMKGALSFGMYVSPEHRHKKVCFGLHDAAVERLKKLGVKALFGGALDCNAGANAVIQKTGAKRVATNYRLDF